MTSLVQQLARRILAVLTPDFYGDIAIRSLQPEGELAVSDFFRALEGQ
jgi:hypothetical protein